MRFAWTVIATLVGALSLACNPVNFTAARNDTDVSWYLITLAGNDGDQKVERTVRIAAHQEGSIDEGIGYSARNVTVLLMTTDCLVADAQTVSGDRVWLTISRSGSGEPKLDELKGSTEVPDELLPTDAKCLAPGVVAPN